jgi:hypothetical protein
MAIRYTKQLTNWGDCALASTPNPSFLSSPVNCIKAFHGEQRVEQKADGQAYIWPQLELDRLHPWCNMFLSTLEFLRGAVIDGSREKLGNSAEDLHANDHF